MQFLIELFAECLMMWTLESARRFAAVLAGTIAAALSGSHIFSMDSNPWLLFAYWMAWVIVSLGALQLVIRRIEHKRPQQSGDNP